jgi:hypothetical protein
LVPAEGPFFFWSGQSVPATAIGNMRRTVDRVRTNAGVEGHPHRCPHAGKRRAHRSGLPYAWRR